MIGQTLDLFCKVEIRVRANQCIGALEGSTKVSNTMVLKIKLKNHTIQTLNMLCSNLKNILLQINREIILNLNYFCYLYLPMWECFLPK